MAVSATSSSLSSMLGVTNKGIGGLVSGLDTDSLVEALTSGTRSKIAKQSQEKQLLNWKINSYRSMATALRAFQTKSLSYSSSTNTNIMSNAFFNTYKATASSDKVTLNATGEAATGTFKIDSIQQLATSASLSSKTALSADRLIGLKDGTELKADAFTGQTLKMEVDGKTRTINLDSLNSAIGADGKLNLDDFKDGFQTLLNQSFGTKNVYVNGEKTTVGVVTLENVGDSLKLTSDASKFYIAADNALLGLNYGDSNRADPKKTTLGQIEAFDNLQGNVFKFSINGTEITANKDDTLSSLISKINSSDAGVTARYSEYTDEIMLTAKSTGAGNNIDIKDVQGNLMNQLFGAQGGGSIGSSYLISNAPASATGLNRIEYLTQKRIDAIGSHGEDSPEYKAAWAEYTADMKMLGKELDNMEFTLTINGETKYVRLDTSSLNSTNLSNGEFSIGDIISAANKGIGNAFGTSTGVSLVMAGGKVTLKSDANTSVSIKGSNSSLTGAGVMGFNEDVSNINLALGNSTDPVKGLMLDATTFADLNSGDVGTVSMTINGKTVDLSLGNISGLSYENIQARLNQAIVGAFGSDVAGKVSFSVEYETVPTQIEGPKYEQKWDDTVNGGNGGYVDDTSKPLYEQKVDDDGELVFDDDGEPVYDTSKYIMEPKFERMLDGDGNPVFDGDGNPVFDLSKPIMYDKRVGSYLTLNVKDENISVSMGAGLAVDNRVDVYEKLGFGTAAITNSPATNGGYTGTKFSDLAMGQGLKDGKLEFTFGDETIEVEYESDMYVQEFIDNINEKLSGKAYASITNGQLSITGIGGSIDVKEIDGGNMLSKVFGVNDEAGYQTVDQEFGTFADGTSKFKEGLNAEVVIDGVVVSKQSNTFNYNGVDITLNAVTDAAITIDVTSDPEDVIKRLKEWMDDYNAMVHTMNQAVNEAKDSEYFPLTDEMKKDMTEDQIKVWEAEAKKGLLRNDNTLKQILSDMRLSMMQKVESAGISLFDIGITTMGYTGDPNDSGKLQFDSNVTGGGEEKLRQMLINDPDKVRLLFTGENGLASRLNTVINNATNTSSVNRGSLYRIAGVETLTGDNTSVLGNKISNIDTYISSLKNRLESEYTRNWKKFTALEMSVQKMSMQSSWFAQS